MKTTNSSPLASIGVGDRTPTAPERVTAIDASTPAQTVDHTSITQPSTMDVKGIHVRTKIPGQILDHKWAAWVSNPEPVDKKSAAHRRGRHLSILISRP